VETNVPEKKVERHAARREVEGRFGGLYSFLLAAPEEDVEMAEKEHAEEDDASATEMTDSENGDLLHCHMLYARTHERRPSRDTIASASTVDGDEFPDDDDDEIKPVHDSGLDVENPMRTRCAGHIKNDDAHYTEFGDQQKIRFAVSVKQEHKEERAACSSTRISPMQKSDNAFATTNAAVALPPLFPPLFLFTTIATHVAVLAMHTFAGLGSKDLTEMPLHAFMPRVRFFLGKYPHSADTDVPLAARYGVFVGNMLIASLITLFTLVVMLREHYGGGAFIAPRKSRGDVFFRVSNLARLIRKLAVSGGLFGFAMALIILFGMTNACVPHPCYVPNSTIVGGVVVHANDTCAPCASDLKSVEHLQDQHELKYPFPVSVCPSGRIQSKLVSGMASLCAAFPTEENPIMCGERYCHVSDTAVAHMSGNVKSKFFIGFPMDSDESYVQCVRLPLIESKAVGCGLLRVTFYVCQFVIFGQALEKLEARSQGSADDLNNKASKPLPVNLKMGILGDGMVVNEVYIVGLAVVWSVFAFKLIFQGTIQF
jgi:hypothetical protein